MRRTTTFRRAIAGLMAVVLLATMLPVGASAEVTTLEATAGACGGGVTSYSLILQTKDLNAKASDVPTSVTLHFADGSTAQAQRWAFNISGSGYYSLLDSDHIYREVPLTHATAQIDTAKYPNARLSITGWPCDPTPNPDPDPTAVVSGTIVQRGNERPVADLEVCLVELGVCTVTDGSGSFAFGDVPYGTYTLTSDGNNWKSASTAVTVEGDTHVNLVQFKGGGNGN